MPMRFGDTSESIHASEYRKALAWHLYGVLHILQLSANNPEIREGFPDFVMRLLHQNAYQISTAITEGVIPDPPEYIVEGILDDYFEMLEYQDAQEQTHGKEEQGAQEETE